MIALIVTIIAILFYIYLAFTFLSYTSLLLNIATITALYFLITRDLKDTENHKYYLFSLFFTAMFFIFSSSGFIQYILHLSEVLLLSLATVACFLVYLFANATGLLYEGFMHLRERYRG